MRKPGIVPSRGARGGHEEAVDLQERVEDPHPAKGNKPPGWGLVDPAAWEMSLYEPRGATWREVIGGGGKATFGGDEGAN
ncbi:hypothetical protein ACE6H2_027798 [Prunus campanulata]